MNKLTNGGAPELQALQNAANRTGLTIHEYLQQDKRKTTKKYFACKNNASISPVLDYEKLNYFLLGFNRGAELSGVPEKHC